MINIHACSVWECYVFFCMAHSTSKFELQAFGDVDTIANLQKFDLDDAHCWSQEDETKLRSIVDEERATFESNIREMATEYTTSRSSDRDSSVMR